LELSLPADSGIDVLLSDMIMPGMDGPELVEKLRSKGRDIPVLYMSGYTPDHLPTNKPFDRALVIDKPFDAPTLLGRLREVLERAHGRVASNPRHGES
jgi:two-component system cell cycle sensor histidine kinase/response regulator CckA